MKRFILAITGASGVCYGKRLFDCLKDQSETHVIISERGVELLNIELGLKPSYFKGKNVNLHKTTKINSSIIHIDACVIGKVSKYKDYGCNY